MASAARLEHRLDLSRSLTLLRVFLVASGAILLAGAIVIGSVLSRTLKQQAVSGRRAEVTRLVDAVVGDEVVRRGRIVIGPRQQSLLARGVRREPDLLSVKVWRSDGTLAWTNVGRWRIGKRFELDGDLGETIRTGTATGAIDDLSATGEDALERRLVGRSHVLEVYAPITSGGAVVGAYEIYARPEALEAAIRSRRDVIWAVVGCVFVAVWVALALLVRGASALLRRQTRELRERSLDVLAAYRRQEESALEAIESLNATVDAKDPYTAGHSLRVQRLAVSIGEELRLPRERLDALRFAALFHDIGKLAVPDAILTKSGPLDGEEFEIIKRHSAEGARIVGRFGRLRATVPIIRHHHERWSGGGYPDGLEADAVSLEAYVVGLADAWDAMTTDRPYHRALSFEEAVAEVRRGRGEQFAPRAVDAFFRVLRRSGVEISPTLQAVS